MKALILGTSNCLLNGGVKDAINAYFGSENVTNLSLGASSGTFLALFRMIEGVDFRDYDYVFFDSIVNEQWQIAGGRSPEYLWKIARILYGALPPDVTYVYLGFSTLPKFREPDIVEHIHRSLCVEFGINFVPFRQMLAHFCMDTKTDVGHLYVPFDPSHFKLSLINLIMKFVLDHLPIFQKKVFRSFEVGSLFFRQDPRGQAASTTIQSTSLRTTEYGQFKRGNKIKLEPGVLLGFDHCEIATEAYVFIDGDKPLQKALHFAVDKPWMKFAAFNSEVITTKNSCAQILAVPREDLPIENTDGTVPLHRNLTGDAKIGCLFYAAIPIDQILTACGLDACRNLREFVQVEALFQGYLDLHRNLLIEAALS